MLMGNNYKVHITKYAFGQMEGIRRYIADELLAPQAARKLLEEMKKAAASLGSLPFRNPLVDEKKWREQGIRRVAVKNFLMYYWVDTEKGIVYITAVVYGKRDQLKQLDKMDME